MYNEYFGIQEKPFSMAPDPRYLFMSSGHREAFAHLLYGVQEGEGGFVLLTGEVGTGKTTVCRCLLEQVPEKTNVALILNPKVTAFELLASVCDEFRIDYGPGINSIKGFVDLINAYLLQAHGRGEKNILIIDEAQNLDPDVLEQMRLLTNLETSRRKLLQIVLLGQPELLDILAQPRLRQLTQRVTARYHLSPLDEKEVNQYVRHRLAVAGLQGEIFPADCLKDLYRMSTGVPRVINVLCDRALLGAYAQGVRSVDRLILKNAAAEILWSKGGAKGYVVRPGILLAGVAVALLASLVIFVFMNFNEVDFTPPIKEAVEVVRETSANTGSDPGEVPAGELSLAVVSENEPAAIDLFQKTASNTDQTTLVWPADIPLSRSRDLAFQTLLEQWGQKPLPGVDPCLQVEKAGLRCLHQQGGLDSLLHFNRPAVLRLEEGEKSYYATVTAVAGQKISISIAGESHAIDLRDLALHWSGDFTLLWKMPTGYVDSIRPGRIGPEVAWLDKQLAVIYKRPASVDVMRPYAGQQVQEIKKFQFSRGLVPDGIVGVQTLVQINTAVANGAVPVLTDGN